MPDQVEKNGNNGNSSEPEIADFGPVYNFTDQNGVKYEQVDAEWIVKNFGDSANQIILESARENACDEVVKMHDALSRTLTNNPSYEEAFAWPYKVQAAKNIIANEDDAADVAMLLGEATARGETLDQIAQVVVTKHGQLSAVIGVVGTFRAKYRSQIKLAPLSNIPSIIENAEAEFTAILNSASI